jgi:hypothetical protein
MKNKNLFFLTIFLIVSFSASTQDTPANVQASVSRLIEQGFVSTNEIKGNVFYPQVSSLELEVFIASSNESRSECWYYYEWIEDNILYEVSFIYKTLPNNVVIAYILEEDNFGKDYWEKLGIPVKLFTFESNPRYGEHSGKKYAITKRFYKFNDGDEPGNKFINIDIDGDGIVQDGEGRYMWF